MTVHPLVTNWLIDLLDDGERFTDGGRDVRVLLVHKPSGLGLGAILVYYGGEGDAVVKEVFTDTLLLAEPTSHRLLTKVCSHYMTTVGKYGDCGLSTAVDLSELVGRLYADSFEGDMLIALTETTIRTFSPSTNRRQHGLG